MKLRLAFSGALFTVAVTLALAFADDGLPGSAGKKPFDAALHGKGGKTGSTQISYHGGPVMNQSNSVYVIYYGTFPPPPSPSLTISWSGLAVRLPTG